MISIIEKRIDSVIAKLDIVAPEWRSKINLDYFTIENPEACVLYYVFGGYIEGFTALRKAGYPLTLAEEMAVAVQRGEYYWRRRIKEGR
jgi:hypothetical protein